MMYRLDGIKTAETLRCFDGDCKIIFTTSRTEYALQSFSIFAFNYIVKPICQDNFEIVLEKAIKSINTGRPKCIVVKSNSVMRTIYYKDILYIESVARKINIYLSSECLSCYLKLDDIELELDDSRFLRCHKSFIVNMDYVIGIEDSSFILSNSIKVPIKQRDFSKFKKQFCNYIAKKV